MAALYDNSNGDIGGGSIDSVTGQQGSNNSSIASQNGGVSSLNSTTSELRVELCRDGGSFGFNIVGGVDQPHIAGHSGIFISKIRPDSVANACGQLHVGDRIVSVCARVLCYEVQIKSQFC